MVLAVILLVVGAPLYFVVKASFTDDATGALTVSNYTAIFTGGNLAELLWNTVVFAVGSAVVAIPIGTLLAWIAERTNTPMRSATYAIAYAGLAIPGVLQVMGWVLLLGPQAGIINVFLMNLLDLKTAPFDLYTMKGMVLVHGLAAVPIVFLLLVAPFKTMDVNLQEAASMSGASPRAVFFRITLRLALPSILAILILTTVTSLESFETPALVGIPGGVQVLTTKVYLLTQSSLLPQYGLASAYGLVLMVIAGIGLWYYARVTRRAGKFAVISGKGSRPRVTDLGRWRWCSTLIVVLMGFVVLAPLLAMLWASFLPAYHAPSMAALRSFTLANYKSLFGGSDVIKALENSILVGIAAATGAALLSAVASWLVIRSRIRGRGALDYLATLPIIFPGIVLGLAVLTMYLAVPVPIYGTLWIIVIAFVAKYLPYGMRFTSPGLLQVSAELEEGAAMCGAGWLRTFRKIVLPLMMASLTGAWVYIFLLSMKELSIALMLYTPGTQINAVQMYNLWENGRLVELGAFGVSVTVVLVALSLLFRKVFSRVGGASL